jgi:superfamily II DNA or RNA helicase
VVLKTEKIMINLRNYQNQLIEDIRSSMRKGHQHIVCQSPTGSGKTIMFSFIVKQSEYNGLRCLVLTDRIELLEQAGGTFEKVGIKYENITASTRSIPSEKVLVAMVETIKRRAKARLDFQMLLKQVDLLIIDECHKRNFDDIHQYLKSECYVLGFTATPIREGKEKPLADFFSTIVEGASIASLISSGHLSKPEYFGVSIDLSGVKMNHGDFDEAEQTKIYGEAKIFEGLKHNLELHAKGKKTMIFCPSVQSSLKVAEELDCLHIDGEMSPKLRESILTKFETTPGSIISNCAITTTGYDCPDIECIVLYRATTSLPLYLQMIGRGSRTTETKKTFTILDFGLNVQRFGYWHIDRTWNLEIPPKKKKNKLDTFPVKFCPECGRILAVNTKVCECGFVWPVSSKERMFAELEKLSYNEIQKRISEAETIEEKEEIRIAKGYKIGFLLHQFTDMSQFLEYEKMKGYKNGWAKYQAKIYLNK